MGKLRRKLGLFTVVLFAGIVGFLLLANTDTVNADSGQNDELLDCLSCHSQSLSYHDSLGSGNNACWTCHDARDMSKLHLADGTELSHADSNVLCGQCHETRYNDWKAGTHGFPGSADTGKCISCHDPHEPQVTLGRTLPHPDPAPPPPEIPVDQVMIGTITIAFLAGLLIIVARREQEE